MSMALDRLGLKVQPVRRSGDDIPVNVADPAHDGRQHLVSRRTVADDPGDLASGEMSKAVYLLDQ
jgi:hypothetical protein